jgi:hypothetical protein
MTENVYTYIENVPMTILQTLLKNCYVTLNLVFIGRICVVYVYVKSDFETWETVLVDTK